MKPTRSKCKLSSLSQIKEKANNSRALSDYLVLWKTCEHFTKNVGHYIHVNNAKCL